MASPNKAAPEQLDLLEPASDEEYIEFDENDLLPQDDNEEDSGDEGEDQSPPHAREKPSRAEKRIRELNAKAKRLEKELDDARAKMQESEKTSKKTVSTLQVSKAEGDVAAASDKVDSAKRAIREAVSSGDDDAIAQAYENLATAVNLRTTAQQWLEYIKSTPEEEEPAPKKEEEDKPAPEQREMTELEKRFVKVNGSWFKKDPVMTMTIQGVNQALTELGYNPNDHDDPEMGHEAYWEELDRQMSEIFGDKYKKVTGKKGTTRTPVTPPSGSPTGGKPSAKTQVRLTPDQLEMAKRLGLDPKRYAQELAKKQRK